jgi:hypothetical protein
MGCDDDTTPPSAADGLTYTEAGVPVYYTEAGAVLYTEAGAVLFTEAGPVPIDAALADASPPKGDGTKPADTSPPKTDTGPFVCKVTTCQGRTLQCGDCKDNDGDKLIDSQDPECLGPCDNTEGPALISDVGGVTGSTCHVDCYFDYGNGMGNDTCWWDHQCDPLEPEKAHGCTYKPQLIGGKFCPQPQDPACAKYCLPLTPNGCDCFGCCTFPQLAGKYVWIGAKDPQTKQGICTLASLTDPKKCPPCTPVPGCNNPCGKCELCVGKTTLPPDCYTAKPVDGGTGTADAGVPPTVQCPGGQQPCGLPGQLPCKQGYYCISGCCIFIDIR